MIYCTNRHVRALHCSKASAVVGVRSLLLAETSCFYLYIMYGKYSVRFPYAFLRCFEGCCSWARASVAMCNQLSTLHAVESVTDTKHLNRQRNDFNCIAHFQLRSLCLSDTSWWLSSCFKSRNPNDWCGQSCYMLSVKECHSFSGPSPMH